MTKTSSFSAAIRNAVLALGILALAAPSGVAQAGPLSWLTGGERVEGSGNIIKQTREPGHFTAIALSIGGTVEVRNDGTESVTIETDDNLLPLIETVVENGTLRIRPAKKNLQLDTRKLKVVVQARDIERISVGGSGSVDAENLRGEKLTFDVGGSGSINVRDMESRAVAVSLGGSGGFKASGATDRLQVSIGGSGRVQTGQLAARNVSISIGGSGRATVWAKQSLSLSVAGSGDVGYYGDPQVSTSIAGSGSVKRLGGAPN